MNNIGFYITLMWIILAPVFTGPGHALRDDTLEEAEEALAQGRHWYATRLLRNLNGEGRNSQRAMLLTATADAGRGAWADVARDLESASWLDSYSYGEGRALLARANLEIGHNERAARNYQIFLSYSVERRPRALAEIGLARALTGLRRGEGAAAAYNRAAQLAPDLEPYLALRAAESLAPSADTAAVREQLQRAGEIAVQRSTLAAVRAHLQADDREGALRLLLNAAAAPGAGEHSTDLRTRAAKLQLESGDIAGARGTLRTALRTAPRNSRPAADLLSSLPGLRAADRLSLARAYERARAPASAVREYREYLNLTQLSKAERDQLRLKIGELLFQARSYSTTVLELEQLVASNPATAIRVRAEYRIARAAYRRGRRTEGRARLRAIVDSFPETGSAINALTVLGDIYEESGNRSRARETYEELAERYPWTAVAGRAGFRLGILAFVDGDYASAVKHFDKARQPGRRNDMRIRATYWAARARLSGGDLLPAEGASRLFREVHARDPFGYYGLLAAERAGIDPWADLPPGPKPAPLDLETSRKFDVIELLRQAGLDEEAQNVLKTIVDTRFRDPERTLGVAEALLEHGYGGAAVRFGWRVHSQMRGLWSASVLRAIYPIAYSEIILAESRSSHLEPHLVAAIARQESAFDAHVISRAGARGLLQIMPQTGRWWAGRMGVRDYSDELLFHPEINLHLGTAYFAALQRQYSELQLALIAYNAGPTRARRWRRRPEYQIDSELFAERIPFSETRGYVRNVQTQLRIYRQLYKEFGLLSASG